MTLEDWAEVLRDQLSTIAPDQRADFAAGAMCRELLPTYRELLNAKFTREQIGRVAVAVLRDHGVTRQQFISACAHARDIERAAKPPRKRALVAAALEEHVE